MVLKPCPFHAPPAEGQDFEKYEDPEWKSSFYRVRCMWCGALGPDASTWIKAQEAWNERGGL